MKIFSHLFLFLIIALTSGCSGRHLINNKEYLTIVGKSFEERKQLADNRNVALFAVFNRKLSVKQTEALKFLYAFMPLSDLADYDGEFFFANIEMSLRAKEETSWGKEIPEDIFLHYVLPCRVNNENLDSFRIVYYDEILNRVRNKNIREAALEINHWCHEKVSYQPADIRTSAPMSTILSARGRCGEESTFTVAALRTAGIPARQVYTPRWAHSDDNHAWVEIWLSGEWFYMGACEPEPVLDLGWFTEPARRAMLVNTKSFGTALGNENAINKFKNYTEVNSLSKYSVTKKIFVKVLDNKGDPVQDAKVEYQLYNYAEFYPLATVPTNSGGLSRFETGLGDLMVWAHKGDDFDYKKITVNETDTLILKFTRNVNESYGIDIDFIAPMTRSVLPGPSKELIEQNSKRLTEENTIRDKYISSWIKPAEVKDLALKLSVDTAKLTDFFNRSMGNYSEIRSFLLSTPDSLVPLACSMLEILPDKDLRDTKGYILSDHLKNCTIPDCHIDRQQSDIVLNYVLNPRIDNELIVGWRSFFKKNLPSKLRENAYSYPTLVIQYLNDNIKICNEENYYKTPLTPKGVFDLKVSDTHSRSICFVAICRSLGIPSRLEPGSMVPQYFFNNVWNDVWFADQNKPSQGKGYLKLVSSEKNPVPEYYHHFTLAKFENGRYNTMEYEENKKITDFKELSLAPGNYMLVTGNRPDDKKVLSNATFFNLAESEHKTLEITLRKEMPDNTILGKIDLNKIGSLFSEKKEIFMKGTVIIWIEPENEPTRHIFNDLPPLKNELDSWGGYFLFLSGSLNDKIDLNPDEINKLPSNSLWGTDDHYSLLSENLYSGIPFNAVFPLVIQTDKDGNIIFRSEGYRIGIGEQILKNIR
ncbi:MAG: transglutaminase-like domain-containing protein [Bacteroidales bacterium]|nr:transglutaminase-like domain-containing protein [Bacteroidales bacterium]